ncbi:MAG: hypothetical protein EPO51_00975 [Phenylobacterium sp.]|uniref:hypothetical protein n=1 Tax=Phenylobacterium sp. TaxID=1871053 RepID=UPI00120258BF|nr:hypothetical protein [Phenylobacterium sp.]TAJ74660.1 MAG: hypothetical protein EPO51_00975 [Phenylobacterium sp.]
MLRHICVAAAFCATVSGPAGAQGSGPAASRDSPPFGALIDSVEAGEIVLRDVCLPGILNRRPIEELALYERLVAMPSRAAGAGADDKVWRLGSLSPVYAVAWADGSCSTYVDRGPSEKLRAMAAATILARPEGFAMTQTGLVDAGRVERTVYCAWNGEERLVATITTPANAKARTRALSSTVYRARGPSSLCPAR